MNFLKNNDIRNYENWINKQNIETKKDFGNKNYLNLINYLSDLVPRQVHSNILLLVSFFIMIIFYYLGNLFYKYYIIYFGLGTFCYLILSNVAIIHSINTKQNSIIYKYLNNITNFIFGKIIISNTLFMFVNLSKYLNLLYFSHYLSYLHLYLYWILIIFYQNKFYQNNLLNLSSSIYLLERFILCWFHSENFTTKHNYLSWITIDLLSVLSMFNVQIFQSILINKYLLYGLPILNLYFPIISNLVAIIYLIYFIYSISVQLKINIFLNHPSVYLPRVYCCGVFDMCHLGHMKLFEKIVKSFEYPIWLIVGVHSDSTVMSYKREPIINEKFREETISLCKYVDEVLPNAELIVTKDFCLEHQIDYVIIGEEYKNNKDKIWYIGGMELNIHKYISRYEPISTTDIIKKIKQHD